MPSVLHKGSPPLSLMVAAQRQANWNAAQHFSSHLGEGDIMPQARAVAAGYTGYAQENVADGTLGYVSAAWAVEQLWANSYGHRLTMLAEATHVGAGVAADAEKEYYVLLGGRPDSNFPPPPDADWGAAPVDTVPEEAVSPAPAGVPCAPGEYWKDGGSGTLFWVDPAYSLVGIVLYQLDPFWIHPIFAKVKALTYQAMEE